MNKTIISVAALSCHAATMQAQKKAAAQRPNIVYIMCDDHAFQCISAYGHAIGKLAPTPNIDRIAERGMRCMSDDRTLQSSERTAPAG